MDIGTGTWTILAQIGAAALGLPIEAVVPRMHLAMLSQPAVLGNRTSLLCNAGFQFACATYAPELLFDPDRKGATDTLVEFSRRVTVTPTDEFEDAVTAGRWPARVTVHAGGKSHCEYVDRTAFRAEDKWWGILHGEDRREFFENVVNLAPGSHARLWEWVKQRLAGAAA